MSDQSQTPRLSVQVPKVADPEGPYCPRRPNLKEILNNQSLAPWTLAAFMAYLSNNHCLETLEFTMDAGRYRKHYQRMMNKAETPGEPAPQDAQYVKELWSRLIEAYIQPNGSREVNLPSEIRDPIVSVTSSTLPPAPEILDPAVKETYRLMEESVLVPFLNSVYPQSAAATCCYQDSIEAGTSAASAADDKSRFGRRARHARSSPPPHGSIDSSIHSSPPSAVNRKSAPSALTTALQKGRFSSKFSPTSSAQTAPLTQAVTATSSGSDTAVSQPGLTDDSGSMGSPVHESMMTPPVTPPIGDLSGSPRSSRDSGAWRKLGRLSGWKPGRKKSQGFNQEFSPTQ